MREERKCEIDIKREKTGGMCVGGSECEKRGRLFAEKRCACVRACAWSIKIKNSR